MLNSITMMLRTSSIRKITPKRLLRICMVPLPMSRSQRMLNFRRNYKKEERKKTRTRLAW
jgi:hypothetical protein